MKFDIEHVTKIPSTFRVQSVISSFDIQGKIISKKIKGELDLSKPWNIGLIVGSSGSGKSSIARELFSAETVSDYKWKAESVLDDMPAGLKVERIVEVMNSVGFSSPPSWIKSYGVLSEGEKMRVTLARAILEDSELFVFDEFTSVIDRQVAKIGSFAVQKAVRKAKRKFIALSCHRDVIEWLQPDWVFDTDEQKFFFANKIDPKSASRFFPAIAMRGDCLKVITI